MMVEKDKDDYELEYFGFGEGMSSAELDQFVHENKDSFYSKELETFVGNIANIENGIFETAIYDNPEKKRWEYWAYIAKGQLEGEVWHPTAHFVSFCYYSVGLFGFNKWTQEIDYYHKAGNKFIIPPNKVN